MKRTLLSLLSLCAILMYAQSDSLSVQSIEEVVVEEVRQPIVRYSALGKTYWSIKAMQSMPMGDPLRNIQLLPGVQTASENTGGTFVQGCDNSHNFTSINGAPVYYPMHLLGYFSTFNSSHFRHLSFSKSVHLTAANRLGAEVSMETTDTIPESFGMDMDLGLLTVQGAMRIPLGKKLGVSVAGRYSDVNLIYDGMINSVLKNNRIAYRFFDVNMGMLYKPTDRDNITVDYYQGRDNADFDVLSYKINSQLEWGNRTASFRWQREGEKLTQGYSLYYSAYHSNLDVDQTDSRAYLPANIQTLGLKSEQQYMANRFFLKYGGEMMRHRISPQSPRLTGTFAEISTPVQLQQASEGALYGLADFMLNDAVELIGGLRASGFYNDCWQGYLDPRVTLRYQPTGTTIWQLIAGTYTQYLHQVGFSSNGLPTEFWISSDKYISPQRAGKISLALQQDMMERRYRVSVETYFTRLTNQVEYKGNALGLVTEQYNLNDNLIIGDGYNYGVDFMLQKNTSNLTGWISYSWAKAPRSFVRSGEKTVYPSAHNRTHDLNAVANWRVSDKWNVSATYIYATGTPYTEIKNGYILGESGIVNYAQHNSSRYPTLTRLDVSVSYRLPSVKNMTHSVKFSVYNATFAKNPISYSYNRFKGSKLYKRPVYIFSTAVPSVSYFMYF